MDIQKYIQFTKSKSNSNKYHHPQVDIGSTVHDKEFTEYLVSIAEIVECQELTSMARESTSKTVQEILEMITPEDSLKSGIKIVHKPMFTLHSYEKWENGYINGFVRTSPSGKPDYFIWTYIRMSYLEEILTKFKDKLVFHGYQKD